MQLEQRPDALADGAAALCLRLAGATVVEQPFHLGAVRGRAFVVLATRGVSEKLHVQLDRPCALLLLLLGLLLLLDPDRLEGVPVRGLLHPPVHTVLAHVKVLADIAVVPVPEKDLL